MFAIEIIVKDSLYAVKYTDNSDEFENNEFIEDYEHRDEFNRLFNNWQNPEYLDSFFNKYSCDLQKEFYEFISIEDAIYKTIEDAYGFQQEILLLAEKGKKDLSKSLQTLFKPLNNREKELYPIPDYQKSKAYGSQKSWLRLYAIRIDKNVFIVTGGAIKLTKTMNEKDYLIKELGKLEKVKQFLITEGIIDDEGIVDFFELEL
ncbi:MAG: hypothetical protein PF487_04735 [Bacteroidales bacterium]|jgi:hypothetical protein|nr:hypothetical protein [Bacteroidales bacterium]